MFAVIESGGKQYNVAKGDIIDIEKINGEESGTHIFDKVLLYKETKDLSIGQPYLENVQVKAFILNQFKDKKQIVFKFKTKTGYKKTQGHRQCLTRVRIEDIVKTTDKKSDSALDINAPKRKTSEKITST